MIRSDSDLSSRSQYYDRHIDSSHRRACCADGVPHPKSISRIAHRPEISGGEVCVCVRVRACVWHHLDSTVRTLLAMFCLSAQRRKRARAEQRCPHVTARRWHVPAAQEMTGSHILRCAEDGDPFDAFWFTPSRPYVVVPRTW